MVGGGEGAFIGAVHRMAAALDGKIELACGAFSRNFANSLSTGTVLGLSEDRCYQDIQSMLTCESEPNKNNSVLGSAMEMLAIVTPNHTHVPIAISAAEAGFHIMSDKPAGVSLAEVEELASTLLSTGVHYGLTHTYLGYPMVWQARHLSAQPEFGPIRKVLVNYTQGWLASETESTGSKQAEWRVDPERSGPAGALGDIGSHAHSLAEFITNSRMTRLSASLRSHYPSRALDDDGEIGFSLENGASGQLISSQICTGDENELTIRIYGQHASLEWRQMEPNTLTERRASGQSITHRAGVDKPLCEEALNRCRLPSGHPEGYIEAFANLYSRFARALRDGVKPSTMGVPGIAEALRGMAFLEAAIASNVANGAWHEIKAPSVGPDLKGLLS